MFVLFPISVFGQGLQESALTAGGWVTRNDYFGLYVLYILFFLPFIILDILVLVWIVKSVRSKKKIVYSCFMLGILFLVEVFFTITIGQEIFFRFYQVIYPMIGSSTWDIGNFLYINKIGHSVWKVWGLNVTNYR